MSTQTEGASEDSLDQSLGEAAADFDLGRGLRGPLMFTAPKNYPSKVGPLSLHKAQALPGVLVTVRNMTEEEKTERSRDGEPVVALSHGGTRPKADSVEISLGHTVERILADWKRTGFRILDFEREETIVVDPVPPAVLADSYVYMLENGRHVKVGVSKHPPKRLASVATGADGPVNLVAMAPGDLVDEQWLHQLWRAQHVWLEWFDLVELATKAGGFKALLADGLREVRRAHRRPLARIQEPPDSGPARAFGIEDVSPLAHLGRRVE